MSIDKNEAEKLLVEGAELMSSEWWDSYIHEYPERANQRPEFGMGEEGPFMGRYGADWGEVAEQWYGVQNRQVGDYTISEEDRFGGEGQGDQYWIVYSFTKDGNTQYFKVDAYYESWNGANWEDAELSEVKAVEVVKTEWR
jgi:hypothetical protein